MSFVALPVTPGTVHAATRQPDHRNPNEHSEAPFASLLDTGTGPGIREKFPPRTGRPHPSDRATHGNTTDQKPAPPAAKNDGANALPDSTEAGSDQDQDAPESKVTIPVANIDLAPEAEAIATDAADVGDTADASTDTTDTPATPDPATATIDTPVVTATTATTVAAPVQLSLEFTAASGPADGEAPVAALNAVVGEAPTLTPASAHDASAESVPPAPAGNAAPKADKSADAATQEQATKAETQAAAMALGEDHPAADAKPDQQLKVHQPQAQQHVATRAEQHSAAKPKIEAPADTTASAAAAGTAAQAEAASNLTSAFNTVAQSNALLPGTSGIAPAATGPAQQPAAVPVPISGVAVEIISQARDGKNRFEIRLDPPELGRVDVRLDIDGQGNVTSRLVVERQDTLDLLRRESSALERALHDAGLKTSNDGLQFSLRDQGSNNARRDDTAGRFTRAVVPTEAASSERSSHRLPRLGGLDIRV